MTDTSPLGGPDLPFRQPAAAPAPAAPPTGTPAAEGALGHSLGGLTANEQRQLAQWEVEGGRLTQEQADEMLRAGGVEPAEQRAEGMPPVSDAAIEQLANSYDLPPVFHDEAGNYTPTMQEADKSSRSWMAAAGFPKNEGAAVVKEIAATAANWEKMDAPSRELWSRKERIQLERVWGADFAENMKLCNQLVSELEKRQPGLVDLLERSGAGNSAMLSNLILGRARAIQHARASSKRAK